MFNDRIGAFRVAAVCFFFLAAGCSQTDQRALGAKERLRGYLEKTFAVRGIGDRSELASYLIGEARMRLESWSDDQFEAAFIGTQRSQPKLSFKESRATSPNEMNITYELSFSDKVNGNPVRITNKKVCYLLQQEAVWYIRECKNLKELIEYQNELTLP